MKIKNKSLLILLLIVIFGALLRIINLSSMPPSLNWDEVSHGYNAYSILQNGRDEWGQRLPQIFRAYGDYKLPIYIYLTAVSEFIFGLNTFAVRFVSAIAGISTIIFTYLLVVTLFKNQKTTVKLLNSSSKSDTEYIALISALLVSVEPWTLFLSRGAFEANLGLAIFVPAVYFFVRSFRKPRFLIVSCFLFGLTVWTYNSYRIFTPIFLFSFLAIYWKKIRKLVASNWSIAIIASVLLLFFITPMFKQLLGNTGQARYGKVAIIDQGAINKINEQRALNNYPPVLERALYNKGTFLFKSVGNNWLKHYSAYFLFFKGGSQFQYNIPDKGLLYLINFPFFVLGVIVIFYLGIKKKDKSSLLLLSWLLLAPIPASITRDSPHTLRAITMLPLPMIFSAIGVTYLISRFDKIIRKLMDIFTNRSRLIIPKVNKAFLYAVYILIISFCLESYLTSYFKDYRKDYSWSWQYGYEEVADYIKLSYSKYDKIILTKKYGEPHIFLLFYFPWDSVKYVNDPELIRFKQSEWYWVDRFDKFYFVNDWDIPTRSDQDFILESKVKFDCDYSKCLLVTSPGTRQNDWKLLKTVNFLDGKPAFEIYDNLSGNINM